MAIKHGFGGLVLSFILVVFMQGCVGSQPVPTKTALVQVVQSATEAVVIPSATAKYQVPTSTVIPTGTPIQSPLPTGEIDFSYGRAIDYAINIATGDKRPIIKETSYYIMDTFTTNSGFVYFLADTMTRGLFQLYRINSDGTNANRISFDNLGDSDLVVTADGQHVAYVVHPVTGGNIDSISIIDYSRGSLAGTIVNENNPIWGLSWSHQGDRLAFCVWNPNQQGESINFLGTLFIVAENGTNKTQVGPDNFVVCDPIAWSPDDKNIIVPIKDSEGINLYKIDLESNVTNQLTYITGSARYPVWSPDGKEVLFSEESDLYTIQPDGNNSKLLVGQVAQGERRTIWSPDSRYIAYVYQSDDNTAINLINSMGGTPIQIENEIDSGFREWLTWPNSK